MVCGAGILIVDAPANGHLVAVVMMISPVVEMRSKGSTVAVMRPQIDASVQIGSRMLNTMSIQLRNHKELQGLK